MNKSLVGIQVSRGIAAVMVVMAHGFLFFEPHTSASLFSPGIVGVDFFFVLSGFIIFYIHHGDIGHTDRIPTYVRKRAIRILPIYWIYTLLFLIFDQLIIGALMGKTLMPYYHGIEDLGRSLALLPPDRNVGASPILPPAWTLSHELLFYLLFGVAMYLGRNLSLLITVCWVTLISLNTFGQFGTTPYWVSEFLLSPLNLEFLMGCLAAWLVCFKDQILARWGKLVTGFGILGIGICWMLSMRGAMESATLRVFTFGPAFLSLILGIVLLEQSQLEQVRWRYPKVIRLLKELGDGSYSIYLMHFTPLFLISIVFRKIWLGGDVSSGLQAGLACAISIALGWLGYRLLEHPMLQALNKRRVYASSRLDAH